MGGEGRGGEGESEWKGECIKVALKYEEKGE